MDSGPSAPSVKNDAVLEAGRGGGRPGPLIFEGRYYACKAGLREAQGIGFCVAIGTLYEHQVGEQAAHDEEDSSKLWCLHRGSLQAELHPQEPAREPEVSQTQNDFNNETPPPLLSGGLSADRLSLLHILSFPVHYFIEDRHI